MIHRGSEARAAKAIRKGAEVNWVDAEGKTPLHYAAKQGELCLLPFGEPLSCMLICMCCAGSGHVHVVYLLHYINSWYVFSAIFPPSMHTNSLTKFLHLFCKYILCR